MLTGTLYSKEDANFHDANVLFWYVLACKADFTWSCVDTYTPLVVASSYIPTSNNYTLTTPWVSDMAGSGTSATGSCHCDCDHTGSCAVVEDKAAETGIGKNG